VRREWLGWSACLVLSSQYRTPQCPRARLTCRSLTNRPVTEPPQGTRSERAGAREKEERGGVRLEAWSTLVAVGGILELWLNGVF
jgi:hypothetical protein